MSTDCSGDTRGRTRECLCAGERGFSLGDAARGGVPGRVASPADDADRLVLEHVAAGQYGEIEILYDRYGAMAFALAYRITGDGSLAEDVVQDAFVGAWRNAARYEQGRASVNTWLL